MNNNTYGICPKCGYSIVNCQCKVNKGNIVLNNEQWELFKNELDKEPQINENLRKRLKEPLIFDKTQEDIIEIIENQITKANNEIQQAYSEAKKWKAIKCENDKLIEMLKNQLTAKDKEIEELKSQLSFSNRTLVRYRQVLMWLSDFYNHERRIKDRLKEELQEDEQIINEIKV